MPICGLFPSYSLSSLHYFELQNQSRICQLAGYLVGSFSGRVFWKESYTIKWTDQCILEYLYLFLIFHILCIVSFFGYRSMIIYGLEVDSQRSHFAAIMQDKAPSELAVTKQAL